jgi:hypothetical protein
MIADAGRDGLFAKILEFDHEGFIMSITTSGNDTASASGNVSCIQRLIGFLIYQPSNGLYS